jgi:OOP family OmpA-OmpF porin
LLVFILLVVNSPAEAKPAHGDFLLSPYAGGYAFDGAQGMASGSIFGLRLGLALTSQWGIESGIGTASTKRNSDAKDSHATLFDLSALYHFNPINQWEPFATAGLGTINVSSRGANLMLNYGVGIHYTLMEKRVSVQAKIRHILDLTSEGPFNNFEYTMGLTFRAPKIIPPPPPPDGDGDKIPDAQDICLNTPLGEQVEENGCSIDHDKDSISDIFDLCPATPIGMSVDKNGCPKDTDLDTVPDTLDKCPNTVAGTSVDTNGCPKDADLDTVPDILDKCPNTLGGTPVDQNGCSLDTDLDKVPDTVDLCLGTPIGEEVNDLGCSKEVEDPSEDDTDQDGIVDALDQCKDSSIGALVNSVGCPLALLKEKTQIELKIQFDPNQSIIKPQYEAPIKAVAEVMISNPETVVEIRGYTDNFGSKKVNRTLSRLRAESVMRYLIDRFGIDPSRLTAKGYGSSNAIADNSTPDGREKNKRIVAVIAGVY